jgi:hypothetical protein
MYVLGLFGRIVKIEPSTGVYPMGLVSILGVVT